MRAVTWSMRSLLEAGEKRVEAQGGDAVAGDGDLAFRLGWLEREAAGVEANERLGRQAQGRRGRARGGLAQLYLTVGHREGELLLDRAVDREIVGRAGQRRPGLFI